MNDTTRLMGPQPLPIGHQLLWYTIEKVLGQGGFGITYLAVDTNLNRKVAIKEYLPSIFAYRETDHTVSPLTGEHGESYSWGLNSFLNEARTLAQFRHRNIVQVQTVFEEHGTAYMVMEYENGESLDQIFTARMESLDQEYFEHMLFPVMDGLEQIHGSGFIHRDIKPGNLYIRSDGSPVLIDFGSARQTSQQNTGEMTTLVSQGYTPLEQYSSNFGDQGPWTDIYSFAASIYHGVNGRKPDDALNRSASLLANKPDQLRTLTEIKPSGYSKTFCSAIDAALLLKPAERPQSLSEWLGLFNGEGKTVVQPPRDSVRPQYGDEATRILRPQDTAKKDAIDPLPARLNAKEKSIPGKSSSPKGRLIVPIAAAATLVVSLAGAVWWFTQKGIGTSSSTIVTQELIQQFPKPKSRISLRSPVERASSEISELQTLAGGYGEALSLDSNSSVAKEGLLFVANGFESISKLPLVQHHSALREQLVNAIKQVSLIPKDRSESLIQSLNSPVGSVSSIDLQKVLAKKDIQTSEREALLFQLSALQGDERTALLSNDHFGRLIGQFKKSIVSSCERGEFAQAASMTEIALMVSPKDRELEMLRDYFETGA